MATAIDQVHDRIGADIAAKAKAEEAARFQLREFARHKLADDQLIRMMFVLVEEVNRRLPHEAEISDALDCINDEIASFAVSVNAELLRLKMMEAF